jgi:hypothetical protein
MAHLHTGTEDPPIELLVLRLCREFNCLPSALEKEPLHLLLPLLTALSAEGKVRSFKNGL